MRTLRVVRRVAAALAVGVTLTACTIEQDLTPRVDDAVAEPEPSPTESASTDDAEGDAVAEASPAPSPSPDPEPSPEPDDTASPTSAPSPRSEPSPKPTSTDPSPSPDPTTSPSPTANRAPSATDDTATVQEDGSVTVAAADNDRDPDGDTLRVVRVTSPTNGTARVVDGRASYVPVANFNGTDRFSYTVQDPDGLEDTGVITVTVTPVNDRPVARADSGYLVQQGGAVFLGNLLDNDSDIDGDGLAIELVSGGTYGTVKSIDDETVEYSHGNSSAGTSDTFQYRVNDGTTFSDPVTVTIGINRRPNARNDALVIGVSNAPELVDFNVISGTFNGSNCCTGSESWNGGADTDPDGDALTYLGPTSISRPSWMLGFQCNSSGRCQIRIKECTYLPSPYTITYTIQDARGGTDTGTMSIRPYDNCIY